MIPTSADGSETRRVSLSIGSMREINAHRTHVATRYSSGCPAARPGAFPVTTNQHMTISATGARTMTASAVRLSRMSCEGVSLQTGAGGSGS